jgi:surface antigen
MAIVFGAILALAAPASANTVRARGPSPKSHIASIARATHVAVHRVIHRAIHMAAHGAVHRVAAKTPIRIASVAKFTHRIVSRSPSHYYGGISCVPFARAASGIDVKGNAVNWWANASGIYARGFRPEPGSVLNFRATGRMRLGHVAVISRVLSSREVEVDQANWWGPGIGRGGVSRGIPVIDVSENNDWSEVRVGLGHSGDFGSVYPTYGFIYDRPDRGVMLANLPSGRLTRPAVSYDEVAEAPAADGAVLIDAPDHSLR